MKKLFGSIGDDAFSLREIENGFKAYVKLYADFRLKAQLTVNVFFLQYVFFVKL